MKSVVVTKTGGEPGGVTDSGVSSMSTVSTFCNMAVWESGYTVCLEICRAADHFSEKDGTLTQQLKMTATEIPKSLSKSASYKVGKKYIRHLREAFVSSKQLATLLMLCHDLNYMPTDKFLDLNSKVNIFSSKLWKYIKYSEKKMRKKVHK
jgi:four helix bundle protein